MPSTSASARLLATPWTSFFLALGGGILLAGSHELVVRVLGAGLVGGGAVVLGRSSWRVRDLVARVLAAIPFQDKSEATLDELPRAWAHLQKKVRDLEQAIVREDVLRWNVLSNLRTGLLLVRRDNRIRLFNPSARVLLGSSSQVAVGSVLTDVFREPESLRAIRTASEEGACEWVLKRGGRVMQARAVHFQGDPEGPSEEDGVLITLDDVTRQEALETTRQKFISNASHELKTPVTSIRIAAEDLLEGQLVAPDGETSLRIIMRSVDRMTMLLNDISELSRIETGALNLSLQRMTVGGFLADLLEEFGPLAAARDIDIRLEVPDALQMAPFMADPYRMHQLMGNLVSNAVKFSPEGATVHLRVGLEGHALRWEVEDHGMGMAPADLQRIFERFYRAPAARAVPGTGLGLAIVKHLALLMQGEVGVASEPGKGSTFTVRLPLAEG